MEDVEAVTISITKLTSTRFLHSLLLFILLHLLGAIQICYHWNMVLKLWVWLVMEEKSWFKPLSNFHNHGLVIIQEEHPHERGSQIIFSESPCMSQHKINQLSDSEMLCKEGRQDFDLSVAGFTDAALGLCLSALTAWNSLCSYSININR